MLLGETYDLSTGLSPVNLATAANTGKRLYMRGVTSVDIVIIKGVGTAGEDPVLTVRQHTAASGGVSTDLVTVADYLLKNEATLDGDETWSRLTQTAAATVTDPGGAGTSAESEQLVVVNVRADQLTPGNTHISLDIADVGTNPQLAAVLYIVHINDRATATALQAPLR